MLAEQLVLSPAITTTLHLLVPSNVYQDVIAKMVISEIVKATVLQSLNAQTKFLNHAVREATNFTQLAVQLVLSRAITITIHLLNVQGNV